MQFFFVQDFVVCFSGVAREQVSNQKHTGCVEEVHVGLQLVEHLRHRHLALPHLLVRRLQQKVHHRLHQVELQTQVHLHARPLRRTFAFLLQFLGTLHKLVLENGLVIDYALYRQKLVHLHFHLRELFGFGEQLRLGRFFQERDQQADVLSELLGLEGHSQVGQQLPVDDLGYPENGSADAGGLLGGPCGHLGLHLGEVLAQQRAQLEVVALDDGFPQLDRVQVELVFDLLQPLLREDFPRLVIALFADLRNQLVKHVSYLEFPKLL